MLCHVSSMLSVMHSLLARKFIAANNSLKKQSFTSRGTESLAARPSPSATRLEAVVIERREELLNQLVEE